MNRANKTIRTSLLVGVIFLLSLFGFNYYENFSNSSDLNEFLEEASIVSLLHNESSKEFEKVLNFDEINRNDFETTLSNLVRDSQEAFNLVQNIGGDFVSSEKELLNIFKLVLFFCASAAIFSNSSCKSTASNLYLCLSCITDLPA